MRPRRQSRGPRRRVVAARWPRSDGRSPGPSPAGTDIGVASVASTVAQRRHLHAEGDAVCRPRGRREPVNATGTPRESRRCSPACRIGGRKADRGLQRQRHRRECQGEYRREARTQRYHHIAPLGRQTCQSPLLPQYIGPVSPEYPVIPRRSPIFRLGFDLSCRLGRHTILHRRGTRRPAHPDRSISRQPEGPGERARTWRRRQTHILVTRMRIRITSVTWLPLRKRAVPR